MVTDILLFDDISDSVRKWKETACPKYLSMTHYDPSFHRWKPPVSPLLALCAFLIVEKHAGSLSKWKPYIDVLPQTYTCPVYFSDDVFNLLPAELRAKALDQREKVRELHSSSKAFFDSLQPLLREPATTVFSHDALRWAWCSVNTRTVYMKHPQSPHLSTETDVYALAPYLDLLNHCPQVQVGHQIRASVFNLLYWLKIG